MPKLSDYVQTAATEYLLETGKIELDAHWAAVFFQDSGVMEEYPRQNMIEFYNMVQKELTKRADRAGKQTRMKLEKISKPSTQPRKD